MYLNNVLIKLIMEKEEDSIVLWVFLLAMGLALGFMFTITIMPVFSDVGKIPKMQPIYDHICKNVEGKYNCNYSRIIFGILSIVFFVFSALMGMVKFRSPLGLVVFFIGWIGGFIAVAMML